MSLVKFPTIKNEIINLIEMEISHSKYYSEILSEKTTYRFLTEKGPVNINAARKKIVLNKKSFQLGKSIYWSIISTDDKFIGYISIHNFKEDKVFISYGIHPSERRKGYATIALNSILNWNGIKGKKVELAVHKENIASYQMLKKMKLKYIGVKETKYGDRHIFSSS